MQPVATVRVGSAPAVGVLPMTGPQPACELTQRDGKRMFGLEGRFAAQERPCPRAVQDAC